MYQLKEDHYKEDEFSGEDVEEKMNPFRVSINLFHI